FERAQVEFFVAAQGRLDVRFLARERRRVEHNGIEALAFLVSGLQEVEAVGFLPLHVREAVQFLVAARERERFGGNLDSEDRIALARQSHRESARVAEAIEQAPARVLLCRGAILALIEKAAGLLPAREVVAEFHAVVLDYNFTDGLAEEHTLLLRQALEGADGRVIPFQHRERRELFPKDFDDVPLQAVRPLTERLKHEAIAIAVDDEARKQIALGGHHTISLCALGDSL